MIELTLQPAAVALSAGGDKPPPEALPVEQPRRRQPARPRRRTALAPLTDGGFRPFRVY